MTNQFYSVSLSFCPSWLCCMFFCSGWCVREIPVRLRSQLESLWESKTPCVPCKTAAPQSDGNWGFGWWIYEFPCLCGCSQSCCWLSWQGLLRCVHTWRGAAKTWWWWWQLGCVRFWELVTAWWLHHSAQCCRGGWTDRQHRWEPWGAEAAAPGGCWCPGDAAAEAAVLLQVLGHSSHPRWGLWQLHSSSPAPWAARHLWVLCSPASIRVSRAFLSCCPLFPVCDSAWEEPAGIPWPPWGTGPWGRGTAGRWPLGFGFCCSWVAHSSAEPKGAMSCPSWQRLWDHALLPEGHQLRWVQTWVVSRWGPVCCLHLLRFPSPAGRCLSG